MTAKKKPRRYTSWTREAFKRASPDHPMIPSSYKRKMKKLTEMEKEKLRPKGWVKYVTVFFSVYMVWLRVPYNLFNGVSLRKCIRQERLDLWNVGLKYRLRFLHDKQ